MRIRSGYWSNMIFNKIALEYEKANGNYRLIDKNNNRPRGSFEFWVRTQKLKERFPSQGQTRGFFNCPILGLDRKKKRLATLMAIRFYELAFRKKDNYFKLKYKDYGEAAYALKQLKGEIYEYKKKSNNKEEFRDRWER